MTLPWDQLRRYLPGRLIPSPEQIEALDRHWQEVEKWNRVVNLTRITRPDEVVRRHYAESLWLASLLPSGALAVVDVGSGAGFPGVPLAVVRPECRVILVEADQRKAVFLRQLREWIRNIEVYASRAESLRGTFDWVLGRALAPGQIAEVAVSNSACFAILTSKSRAAGLAGRAIREFHVSVKPLPWDPSSCVVLGENVSRGTPRPPTDFHLQASDAKIS